MGQIKFREFLFEKFKIIEKFSSIEKFQAFDELNVLCKQNNNELISINSLKTIESITKSLICENKSLITETNFELLSIVLFTSDTNSSLNKMCLKLLQQNYKTENSNIFQILSSILSEENEEYFKQNIDNIYTVVNSFAVCQEYNFETIFKYFQKVFTHLKIEFNDKLTINSMEMNSNEVNFFCDLYHCLLRSVYILIQKFKSFEEKILSELLANEVLLSLIDAIECQVLTVEVIPIGCLISGSFIISLFHSLNGKSFDQFLVYINEKSIFDERSRLSLISSSFITFPTILLRDNQMFNNLEILKTLVKHKNRKESQFLLLYSNLFLNWTQVMIKILKDFKQEESVFDRNKTQIIDYFCNEMIEFVENNFNSSIDQIDRIMKNVFLIKQCLLTTEELKQYFRQIISQLDCKSKNPLNKYRFLIHIHQSIGGKQFIQVFGDLINELFSQIKLLFDEKNDGINEIFHFISVVISLPDQKIIDQLINDLCLWIKTEEVCHHLSRTNLLFAIILPKLIKKHSFFVKTICIKLLEEEKDLNCKQMLSIIKMIKSIDENLLESIHYNQWLNKSLSHFEDDIRLDCLSLVIESRKTTQIFSDKDLQLIYDSIDSNMNCQQSSSRQRFVALIQKMFQRLNNSLNYSKTSKTLSFEKLKTDYNNFIEKVIKYCLENLRKTQYFGTTSTKLQILNLINSLLLENEDNFFVHKTIDFNKYLLNLFDIISDSFEENKSLCVKIIINYFHRKVLIISENQINEIKKVAKHLSESPTPGHSITAAFLYKLIVNIEVTEEKPKNDLIYELIVKLSENIEQFLEWAQKDVVISAAKYPLYTKLSSIRSVLNEVDFPSIAVQNIELWKQLIIKVIDLCYQCSKSVNYIVCNDSPEGHLPMDCHLVTQEFIAKLLNLSLEHISNEKVSHITSQMLLLNGWKTIKESAWLLAELTRTANQFNFNIIYDKPIIDCEQTIAIIEFLYSNLMSLKHRGAFEQTAAAFTLLIAIVWTNKCSCSAKVVQLLDTIIQNLKDENESEIKGCVTRRSAGLPFIIQAILSGEPSVHNNQYFNHSMSELLEILSDQNSKEWQIIHCLNIIRALMRDHRMVDKVNPFIERTTEISFIKFKSNLFAVRNCSAMLCNCLMTKMFGVKRNREDNSKKNRMSSKLFFTNYPSLYDFLLKEISICSHFEALEHNCSTNVLHIESLPLYPLLILLSKLMPSINTTTVHNMNEFLPYLKTICLNCRHYKLRVLSAKVFAQLVQESDIEDYLSDFCHQLIDSKNLSENNFHGLSLLLKHLFAIIKTSQQKIVSQFGECLEFILFDSCRQISFYSMTPFIQIIEILCEKQMLTIDQKYKFSEILLSEFNSEKHHSMSKTDEYVVYLSRSLILCLHSMEMQIKFLKKLFLSENNKCFEAKLIFLKVIINSVLKDSNIICDLNEHISYESVFPVPSTLLPNIKQLLNDHKLLEILLLSPEFHKFCEFFKSGITSNYNQFYGFTAISNAFISEIFRLIFYSTITYEMQLKSILKFIENSYALNFEESLFFINTLQFIEDEDIKCFLLLSSAVLIAQVSDQQWTSYLANGLLEKWCQIIIEFSCDHNFIIRRKIAAKILSISFQPIIRMKPKSDCILNLWKALINLIEDNDMDIRREAVQVVVSLENNKVLFTSKKALELCVKHFIHYMDFDSISCIHHLIQWIIESNVELDCDDNEDRLFDKSKLNIFADSVLLTDILIMQLKSTLVSKALNLNDLRLPLEELMGSLAIKQLETTNEEAINHLLLEISKDNNIYGSIQQLLESDCNYNTFKQNVCSKLIQTLIESTDNGLRRHLNI